MSTLHRRQPSLTCVRSGGFEKFGSAETEQLRRADVATYLTQVTRLQLLLTDYEELEDMELTETFGSILHLEVTIDLARIESVVGIAGPGWREDYAATVLEALFKRNCYYVDAGGKNVRRSLALQTLSLSGLDFGGRGARRALVDGIVPEDLRPLTLQRSTDIVPFQKLDGNKAWTQLQRLIVASPHDDDMAMNLVPIERLMSCTGALRTLVLIGRIYQFTGSGTHAPHNRAFFERALATLEILHIDVTSNAVGHSEPRYVCAPIEFFEIFAQCRHLRQLGLVFPFGAMVRDWSANTALTRLLVCKFHTAHALVRN